MSEPLYLGACSVAEKSPSYHDRKAICDSRSGRWRNLREGLFANEMSEMPALKLGDKVMGVFDLGRHGAEN